MNAAQTAWRLSLREFLLLFTAAVVGCAALMYANWGWLAFIGLLTIAAFSSLFVVALVDRGACQAFAIGFIACAGVYFGLVYGMRATHGNSGWVKTSNAEMDPHEGWLPTTMALRPLFDLIADVWYIDPAGARVLGRQVSDSVIYTPSGALAPGYKWGGEIPEREPFMRIGHCLWGLLFGYAGGHFARWIYGKRMREATSAT
jgi:hypothetical protein